MIEDLWPDDIRSHTSLKAPLTILKEQGTLLGRKTSNLVEGLVRGANVGDIIVKGHGRLHPITDNDFCYEFHLVAPALGDYRYYLLRILHSVDFYPLTFITNEGVLEELPADMKNEDDELIADTPEEFMDILKAIFATKKVRRVIEAIIAQSAGGVEQE